MRLFFQLENKLFGEVDKLIYYQIF